jgi:hypothetical protein
MNGRLQSLTKRHWAGCLVVGTWTGVWGSGVGSVPPLRESEDHLQSEGVFERRCLHLIVLLLCTHSFVILHFLGQFERAVTTVLAQEKKLSTSRSFLFETSLPLSAAAHCICQLISSGSCTYLPKVSISITVVSNFQRKLSQVSYTASSLSLAIGIKCSSRCLPVISNSLCLYYRSPSARA